MSTDPFYEPMTIKGQLRLKMQKAWPSIYKLINHFFFSVVDSLRAMLESVKDSLKPF